MIDIKKAHRMETLLIQPNFFPHVLYAPIRLGHLASCLKRDGPQVTIYDGTLKNAFEDNFLEELNRFIPGLVGITLMSRGYTKVKDLVSSTKGRPDILNDVRNKLDLSVIEKILLDFRKVGIRSYDFFIFGLLRETHQTIRQTIDFTKNKSHRTNHKIIAEVLRRINNGQGKILKIGYGYRDITANYIAPSCASLIAIDTPKRFVREEISSNIKFQLKHALNLCFLQTFGGFISVDAIEHVEDPGKLIKESLIAPKNGGTSCISWSTVLVTYMNFKKVRYPVSENKRNLAKRPCLSNRNHSFPKLPPEVCFQLTREANQIRRHFVFSRPGKDTI